MHQPLSIPERAVLEDEVRRLLERARNRAGATVPEMIDALGGLQAKGAGSRRSWYDWQEKPETVSALTTLGALHILGPAAAMELLFERKDGASLVRPDAGSTAGTARIADLEAQLATLAELVHGLQEAMDVVQEQLLQAGVRRSEPTPAAEVGRTPT